MADFRDTTIPRRTRRRHSARRAGRHGLAQRAALEALIERAIAALDALDGDPDLEDGDEDRCPAHDDDPAWWAGHGHGIGSEDDAEPDNEDLGASEDEPDFPHRGWRPWRPDAWGSINRPCADALAGAKPGGLPTFRGRRA